MSHVDDGRIEAWLDRKRSGMDARESAEIADHLGVCYACASRMEAALSIRDRAVELLGTTRLTDARLPDFERVRARAGYMAVSEPGRAHAGHRPLMKFAWAASIVGAIGLGWVTRDLLAPRPLAYDAASERTSEAEARGAAGAESVMESPSTRDPFSSRVLAGSAGGVARGGGLAGQVSAAPPVASSGRTGEATANSSRAAVQSTAVAAPATAGGAGAEAIEADPAVARDQAAPGADPSGLGAIPSLNAPQAIGYSRQAFAQPEGRDTIAGLIGRPVNAIALEGGVAGSDRDRAAEASAAAPPAASPVAVADRTESAASGTAARAEAIFAPSTEGGLNPAWPGRPINMGEGARRLGVSPVAVPNLDILSINLVETAEGPIVHLRQRLPDGGILLLAQRVGRAPELPSKPTETNSAEARRGPLHITAVAPLSQGELGDLLDSAR